MKRLPLWLVCLALSVARLAGGDDPLIRAQAAMERYGQPVRLRFIREVNLSPQVVAGELYDRSVHRAVFEVVALGAEPYLLTDLNGRVLAKGEIDEAHLDGLRALQKKPDRPPPGSRTLFVGPKQKLPDEPLAPGVHVFPIYEYASARLPNGERCWLYFGRHREAAKENEIVELQQEAKKAAAATPPAPRR